MLYCQAITTRHKQNAISFVNKKAFIPSKHQCGIQFYIIFGTLKCSSCHRSLRAEVYERTKRFSTYKQNKKIETN